MTRQPPRRQQGFSLIELMVAFAISMVLVIGAVYLYMGTRTSQQALDQSANATDVGLYLLHMVGRDIGNAGFYPSISAEAGLPNVVNRYINITGAAAYEHGIFGCEGALFNRSNNSCGTPVPNAPDTLVVGYFTNDSFNGQAGQRLDCEGADVGTALINSSSRLGAGTAALSPQLPLFVANHYSMQTGADSLTTTTMQLDGRDVTTRSLLCKGTVSAGDEYKSLMSGLADFQVTFGVAGDPPSAGGAAVRFVNANQVNDPSVAPPGTLPPWQRVVAVRVCLVTQTFESATAATSTPQQWQGCDDTLQTPTDLSVRKTFTQVFTVRNHLNATY